MKIIFSKDFVDQLTQVGQFIRFTDFSILVEDKEEGSDLLELDNENKKPLDSIWDNETRVLKLSIPAIKINPEIKYLQIIYTNSDKEKNVAFILKNDNNDLLVGEDSNKGEFKITRKNLIDINLSNIPIVAAVETNLTDNNIKILESPIDVGNNIYLVSSNDLVTITKKSYLKKLYQLKCTELHLQNLNSLPQDYINSSTGEHVYRNIIVRYYNPNKFFPKLVGDVINSDNNYGLKTSNGRIKVTGIVGYIDYIIQNNKVVDYIEGYQSLEEINKITVDSGVLKNKQIDKIYKPISFTINDKIIEYEGFDNFNESRGNTLNIYLKNIKIDGIDFNHCEKTVDIIQSNKYNNPLEFIIPSNIDYYNEYENMQSIPVIVFDALGNVQLKNNSNEIVNTCEIKLVTTNQDIINTIDSGNVDFNFEYSEKYKPIEIEKTEDDSTEILSTPTAEEEFKKFFNIYNLEKINNTSYKLNIDCTKLEDGFELPENRWAPVNSKNDQLLIKCTILINNYSIPFYVIRKPFNNKSIKLLKNIEGIETAVDMLQLVLDEQKSEELGEKYYKTDPFFIKVGINSNQEKEITQDRIWLLNNINTKLVCRSNITDFVNSYGTLLKNENNYTSEELIFTTNVKQDLNSVSFYCLDVDSYESNSFNLNDWKSTIFLPKISTNILYGSYDFTVQFNSISDDFSEIKEIELDRSSYDDSLGNDVISIPNFNIGRLGKFPIYITSTVDKKLYISFLKNVILENSIKINYNDNIEIGASYKEIFVRKGEKEKITITFDKSYSTNYSTLSNLYYNFGMLSISEMPNQIVEEVRDYNHILISLSNFANYSNYLKSDFISRNTGYYMNSFLPKDNNIFISNIKNKNTYYSGEINIEFTSPLTPIITGNPSINEDSELILGTEYNGSWDWRDYISDNGINNLGYYNGNIPILVDVNEDDIEYIDIEDSIDNKILSEGVTKYSIKIPCSYRFISNRNNLFNKFPTDKVGDLNIYHKGLNIDDYNSVKLTKEGTLDNTLKYNIYREGLSPKIYKYNIINDSITNLDYFSEFEHENNIYITESDLNNTIILKIISTYPITETTTSVDIINNSGIVEEVSIIDTSTSLVLDQINENYYKKKLIGESNIRIKLIDTGLLSNTSDLTSINIIHQLPNNLFYPTTLDNKNYNFTLINKDSSWCELEKIDHLYLNLQTNTITLNKLHSYKLNNISISGNTKYVYVPKLKLSEFNNYINFSSLNFNLEINDSNDELISNFITRYNEKDLTIFYEDNKTYVKLENSDFDRDYENLLEKITLTANTTKDDIDIIGESSIELSVGLYGIIFENNKDIRKLFLNSSEVDISTTVPYDTVESSFSIFGIIDFENLTTGVGEFKDIFNKCKIEFIDDLYKNDTRYIIDTNNENDSSGNVVIYFPENKSNNDKEIKLKITYDNINISYKIIQKKYTPLKLVVNDVELLEGSITESKLVFHSSGNLIYFDSKKNNELKIKVPENIEIGKIEYSFDNEKWLPGDTIISTLNNLEKIVIINIDPNYIRTTRSGKIKITSSNTKKEHSWIINFVQGYITADVTFSDTNKTYSLTKTSDNQIIGYVGSYNSPISYFKSSVKLDPYFYVKVVQKEYYIDTNNNLIEGDEILISKNYSNYIDKIKPDSPNYAPPVHPGPDGSEENKILPYATVMYSANLWKSEIDLDSVFLEGFDTDLYYSNSESYYPRLIHKFEVKDDYWDDEFIFNIQVRFSIDKYKKYPYSKEDIENNVNLSPLLSLDTTPILFLFYIKKEKNKKQLLYTIYEYKDNKYSETNELYFYGNDNENTAKNLLIKFELPGKNIYNSLNISSSSWINLSIDAIGNTISVCCDENKTEDKKGEITFTPKDLSYWSGNKTITVYRKKVNTYLLYEGNDVIHIKYEDEEIKNQGYYFIIDQIFTTKPIFEGNDFFSYDVAYISESDVTRNWIREYNKETDLYFPVTNSNKIPDTGPLPIFHSYNNNKDIVFSEINSTTAGLYQFRWLLVIENNTTKYERKANITLKLKYRVEDLNEDIFWEKTFTIHQLDNSQYDSDIDDPENTLPPEIDPDNPGDDSSGENRPPADWEEGTNTGNDNTTGGTTEDNSSTITPDNDGSSDNGDGGEDSEVDLTPTS